MQQLWGEIGKSREERERMVRELEAECMRVYRRKVDEATGERAALHQSLAAGEAEIAALAAALGSDSGPQLKVLTSFHNLLLLVPDLMSSWPYSALDAKTRCKLILANDRYAPSRGLLPSGEQMDHVADRARVVGNSPAGRAEGGESRAEQTVRRRPVRDREDHRRDRWEELRLRGLPPGQRGGRTRPDDQEAERVQGAPHEPPEGEGTVAD